VRVKDKTRSGAHNAIAVQSMGRAHVHLRAGSVTLGKTTVQGHPLSNLELPRHTTMHQKVVKHQYPLIDQDPHASRVIRYMRPSDYGMWAAGTAGFPGLLYFWRASHPFASASTERTGTMRTLIHQRRIC
jgi:hypothetical protein